MLKKIMLFLLVLIIIPNTFAAITIEVLSAPVISAELVEGGSLSANTTYYFAAFKSVNNQYSGHSASPASNMISITTTDTHKSIKISWQDPIVPNYKLFIRWDTSSLQDENGEYIAQESNKWTTTGWIGHTGSDVTLTSLSTQGTNGLLSHPELSILPEYLDNRLNHKKGTCIITITGTETYENLMTAINNSEHSDLFIINNNSLTSLCSIYGTGSLPFENKNINFLHTANLNPNITFQNCSIINQYRGPNLTTYGNYYDSSIYVNNTYQYKFQNNFSNIKLNVQGEFYFTAAANNNVDVSATSIIYYNTTQTNRRLTNISYRNRHLTIHLFNSIRDTNTEISNNYFEDCGSYDTLFYASSSGYLSEGVTDDSNYNFYNSYSNRSDRLPLISYVSQASWNGESRVKAKLFYTQYFNITDKFGNPIDQAKITIKDSNNTIVSEIYTDINGSIDYNLMTHIIEYDSGNANGIRSKSHYQGPFTIMISKDQYYTYRSKQEITSEKNHKISLQD